MKTATKNHKLTIPATKVYWRRGRFDTALVEAASSTEIAITPPASFSPGISFATGEVGRAAFFIFLATGLLVAASGREYEVGRRLVFLVYDIHVPSLKAE